MWQDILDIYRAITAILLIVGLVLAMRNLRKYRTFWNNQERVFIRATTFLALAPIVGLPWNVYKHASINVGLPFVTVGAMLLIYSSLTKPERLESAEAYLKMQERRDEPDPHAD